MKCPFCGSNLGANAKYCNDCGTAVDSPESHRAHNVYRGNPPYNPAQRQSPIAQRRPAVQNREPSYRQQTNTSQSISNAPYNRKPVKKNSGCAVLIFIIVALFFLVGVINSIVGDDWMNKVDDFFSKLDSGEEITIFDSDSYPYGAVVNDYYENEEANLRLRFPDGFEFADDTFEERELVGTYSNEFEIVKDGVFIQVAITDEFENSAQCLRQYTVNRIESIYERYSFDEAECDDTFSVEETDFCNRNANTVTIHYSIGNENHVFTLVGFDVGKRTMVICVDSPLEDINNTVLNQFDEY